MKLVIDIPEDVVSHISCYGLNVSEDDKKKLISAIDYGYPLSASDDCVNRIAVEDALFNLGESVEEYWQDAIDHLRSVEPEPRWIPVTEKLPKVDEVVLVTCAREYNNTVVDITTYSKRGFLIDPVTAWMPLPRPFEE